MNLSNFNSITSLSNEEISENIGKIETEIFNLRMQNATQQEKKPHKLKFKTRMLAQLKTLLTARSNKKKESTQGKKPIKNP